MKKYIILFLILHLLIGCSNKSKNSIAQIISEWDGRQVVYPHNLVYSINGKNMPDYIVPLNEYTILNYVDSVGCTSCKLQLPKWNAWMEELDSISNSNVNVIFFMHPQKKKEIDYILKRDNFNHPVCIDEADSLNKLNHFPADMRFQTFLLDKNNKVLAIGNPIHNPKVKELYMKIILGDKAPKKKDEIKTMAEMGTSFIDFGDFDWKVEQKATFKLKNTGAQPLVILDVTTSCGCISAEFPKEPLAVGKEAEIAVVYKADKPEHFNKTVTVYCNAENAPFTVKVTGTAK